MCVCVCYFCLGIKDVKIMSAWLVCVCVCVCEEEREEEESREDYKVGGIEGRRLGGRGGVGRGGL